MDLLKAEILKKRKATDELINNVNPSAKIGNTRFVRQADVKRVEEEKKAEAQRLLDESRAKLNAANAKIGETDQKSSEELRQSEFSDLSRLTVEQVKYRLRAIRHPITLFGETDSDRLIRLIRAQSEEQQDEDFRLGSGHNVPNPFLRSSNPDNDDDDADDDDEVGESFDNEQDDDSNEETKSKRGKPVFDNVLFSKIEGLAPEKVVHKYFRTLLKRWEWDLDAREDRDKLTTKGKIETKTQKQCKDYIRPLFKLCKRREIPADICGNLVQIVTHCEDGNFKAAHDMYLKTAIGNAAWPIGLTMVGIHERSGREKISSSKVAHVMNNECQRKYLTSIKRLMTFAQTKRPDVPPSLKVR